MCTPPSLREYAPLSALSPPTVDDGLPQASLSRIPEPLLAHRLQLPQPHPVVMRVCVLVPNTPCVQPSILQVVAIFGANFGPLGTPVTATYTTNKVVTSAVVPSAALLASFAPNGERGNVALGVCVWQARLLLRCLTSISHVV